MHPAATPAENLLLRDRLIVGGGLIMISALGWLWLLIGAGTGMSAIAMTTVSFPPPARMSASMPWSSLYWVVMLSMWWVMMIAMMTPSAAPMILLYARVARNAQARGQRPRAAVPTGMFYAGYVSSWFLFSLGATTLHWSLEQSGVVHSMMMWSVDRQLTGALLVAAGLYQLTPLKQACLEHCRSPADYLSRHWRDGPGGAWHMGFRHGLYCVGCCWVLMLLLFAGGVMNLVWIAGLAILILAEKLIPAGRALTYVVGAFLVGAGGWLLLT